LKEETTRKKKIRIARLFNSKRLLMRKHSGGEVEQENN
jgi:hypothetical protein